LYQLDARENAMKRVKCFVAKQSSAVAIEYALIAVGIVLAATVALDVFATITSGLLGSAVGNLMLGH
jgi:Flp pilus assembly pilin Flp